MKHITDIPEFINQIKFEFDETNNTITCSSTHDEYIEIDCFLHDYTTKLGFFSYWFGLNTNQYCTVQLKCIKCTQHLHICGEEGTLSSNVIIVIQILINKDRKSQFHVKELFLQGISSMAGLIPLKESVPRNRVPTTMNVLKFRLRFLSCAALPSCQKCGCVT